MKTLGRKHVITLALCERKKGEKHSERLEWQTGEKQERGWSSREQAEIAEDD